jgi:hypothetical protein
MLILHVYWRFDKFRPSIFTGNTHSIFQLWFHLKHGSKSNESSGIDNIKCFNMSGRDVTAELEQGYPQLASCVTQEYRGD